LLARSFPNAASQPTAAPLHALTTAAMSAAEQLVEVLGGSVTASGLQPENEPGQTEPFEQTWLRHVSFFAVQLSQRAPNCPHAAPSAPPKHMPMAVQHPAQLLDPQEGPA
jgi:hypothetical protein